MKTLYSALLQKVSLKLLVLWMGVYASSLLFFMLPLKDKIVNGSTSGLLDLMPFFSQEKLYNALETYGPLGRAAYVKFAYYDFIYPLVYAVLLIFILALAFKRIQLSVQKGFFWLVLPVLAVFADFGENLGFLSLIHIYPNKNEGLFTITFVLSSLKWLIIYAVVLRALATLFQKKKA